VPFGRLVDVVIPSVAHEDVYEGKVDLDEARAVGDTVDLGCRLSRVLRSDHDRRAKALVHGEPLRRQPVVRRRRDGRSNVGIRKRSEPKRVARDEDAAVDVECVQELPDDLMRIG